MPNWISQGIIFLIIIIALAGVFYLKARLAIRDFRLAVRLIKNSTPLIRSLIDYTEKSGIKECTMLEGFFAPSHIFPRQELRQWIFDPTQLKITMPMKQVIELLKNKNFAVFELALAEEIGHHAVGIEKIQLQQECSVSGPCLYDEIRAMREALEIIKNLCAGIKNWKPIISGEEVEHEDMRNLIENSLNLSCQSCWELVGSGKCPRSNMVLGAQIHIKRTLDIKTN